MFERCTDRSRRALVLAQEDARVAQHDHIHPAHLLAGLIHEGEGIAAQVLTAAGVDADTIRERGTAPIPSESKPVTGHIPFTQAVKGILEYSLREALQLGCNYVGTEHLLLAFLRWQGLHGDGLLDRLGLNADEVRAATLRRLVEEQQQPKPAPRLPWRVGRQEGRTVRTIFQQIGPEPSDDDVLIGVMDTPELAREVVDARNSSRPPLRTAVGLAAPHERTQT
jgi:ATP-dependent Clp protease ATP-binding subunit ClpA